MVEKSVKLSSRNTTPLEIISQALVSKSLARNLKVCGNKGAFPCRKSDGDLAKNLSDISEAEVAGYLNNKKEYLLNKMAWEMMYPECSKGNWRKVTIGKKKDPANKTAPTKKTSATRTKSNVESDNKKRSSLEINYNVLDKLFDDGNSPKRTKIEKSLVVGDQMEYSKQSCEESISKSQGSEVEEPDWIDDYSNEDVYRGDEEERYGDEDFEFEDQDEEEDNDGVIW